MSVKRYGPFLRLMRLHQPVGIWLLLWPCWWSATLLAPGAPPIPVLLAFAAGAVAMRAAGCIINDLWDRELDAQVERTRTRPLASGEVTSREALILLAMLLFIGLGAAAMLGTNVVLWAMASLPLIIAYPLMKRITWWPQAFLGFTFNWGALLGSVAVQGHITLPALCLYIAGVWWTLGYDTIYAGQDMRDDAHAGIRSSALRLGGKAPRFIAFSYGLCITLLATAGYLEGAGTAYFIGLGAVASHFLWQISRLDMHTPESCKSLFISNRWAGALIWLACLLSHT